MSTHQVVIVLFDGVQPLDAVGPHEVLTGAAGVVAHRGLACPRYEVRTAAATPGVVRTESGLALVADHPLPEPGDPVDTIVVPGGSGARRPQDHPELVAWLRASALRAGRVATVCTGAFLAAAAGLCDGKRVTTHWAHAGELATAYPRLHVAPDALYVHDDGLWTSAGVTAGIDLTLALVEHDCGAAVAQVVARHLVVHVRRAGGQTQFAAPVWTDPPETHPIRAAVDHVHAHPEADLSIEALAAVAGLSPRHFVRRFRAETGETAGAYVERVRVEAARRLLEDEASGLDAVARRSGFASAETLRRAFHRRLGISPAHYRRHHRPPGRPAAD